ncbi:MAG: hypothetical protein R3320_01285 [Nitriliruptorales bacterium]|nr:hypothetical protein [Nitriliruptorales bacterium]
MRWYAERSPVRARQILGDLLLVAWGWVWWRIATHFRDLIEALTVPGEQIEAGGERFASGLTDVASRVGEVPLAGDALRAPFEALAGAADSIAGAGVAQQQVVHDLAAWSFWLLLLVPLLMLGIPYVAFRLYRARQAAFASRLRESGDLHLLAVRAAANRSLASIMRVSEHPGRDLQERRPEALAGLELRQLGLEPVQAKRR